jgi:hypothetical protein
LPQARIHDDVYADLAKEAAARERSITWTLNRLLREALERCGGYLEPKKPIGKERTYERIDD